MDALRNITGQGLARYKPESVSESMYQLAQLLHAGVAVADALDDLHAMERCWALRCVWLDLAKAVKSGASLSEAMKRWPQAFDSTVVALVHAGERSGALAASCESTNQYLSWHCRVKAKMLTLMIYPLFSFVIFKLVLVFLFAFVVPSIKDFLISGGVELPWHTVALIALSEWTQSFWIWIFAFLGFAAISVVLLSIYSDRSRLVLHSAMVRIPMLGGLIVDLSLSRYAHCSAQLYGRGIPLEESLKLSEQTVGNLKLRQQLATIRVAVVRGGGLADSMKHIACVPHFFKRMILVGESTGALERALTQVSEQQRQRSDATIERVQQLLAPVMLVAIGGCLLWIVISIISPVYSAAIDAAVQI